MMMHATAASFFDRQWNGYRLVVEADITVLAKLSNAISRLIIGNIR